MPCAPCAPQSVTLARNLIREIQGGRYLPGQKMESVRTLAERYGVGRQVVLSAFALLIKQNFVQSEPRRGFFVSDTIRIGYFYRLGFFVNMNNPISGLLASQLHMAAQRYGWTLMMSSNYEESDTLADFLARKNDLDGIMITGTLDASLLKTLRHCNLPYVIIGNYDLDDRYEQVRSTIMEQVYEQLCREIKNHKFKSMAAICGPEFHFAERQSVAAIRQAFNDCGLSKTRSPVFHAPDDGYPEVTQIMRDKPDAIFFLGEHCLGFRKYRQQHPEETYPHIFISSRWQEVLFPGEYDTVLDLTADDRLAERSVLRLLELIKSHRKEM